MFMSVMPFPSFSSKINPNALSWKYIYKKISSVSCHCTAQTNAAVLLSSVWDNNDNSGSTLWCLSVVTDGKNAPHICPRQTYWHLPQFPSFFTMDRNIDTSLSNFCWHLLAACRSTGQMIPCTKKKHFMIYHDFFHSNFTCTACVRFLTASLSLSSSVLICSWT